MSAPDSDLSTEVKVLLALGFTQETYFPALAMEMLVGTSSLLDKATLEQPRTHGRFTTSTAVHKTAKVLVQCRDSSVWVRERPLDLFDYAALQAHHFIDETDPKSEQLFATRQ